MKYPKTFNLICRIIFLMILTFVGLKMPNFTAGIICLSSAFVINAIWSIIVGIKYEKIN